jgi:hypothetical protein
VYTSAVESIIKNALKMNLDEENRIIEKSEKLTL